MAIREITLMGDPVLSAQAKSVDIKFMDSQKFQNIILDMQDTLEYKGGVGLAAPQIGESYRIFILNILSDRAERESCNPLSYQFFINPVFIYESKEKIEDAEACFSMPGLMGSVNRAKHVEIKAMGLDKVEFSIKACGFLARVLQHEMDHLNGKLYWLRISHAKKFGFVQALPGACDPRTAKPTLKSSMQ